MYENVSVKLSKKILKKIREAKAKMMLEQGEQISDSKVVEKAFGVAFAHESEFIGTKKRKTRSKSLLELAGSIKGGPRTNCVEEIDKVVYGV